MTDDVRLKLTEKRLRDALVRLVSNRPTNRELKRKLRDCKLKINVSNVEKEAGLANGAAKRYPATKEMIENAEVERLYGESDVSDVVIRAHPLYKKEKDKLEKASAEIKRLKAELESKGKKLENYKGRIKEQAVRMHQMNVAMWGQIPDEKKHVELMIDVQSMGMK